MVIILMVGGGILFFIGIMAVLAISGVRKYLQNAKMVEATNTVGAIGRAAVAAYDDPPGTPLCASATAPVPSSISMVSDATANAGFACLKFAMSYPQYYQYDYERSGSGHAAGDSFHAIAHGDLDGDGDVSTFDLTGSITKAGDVALSPSIAQTSPTE